MKSQLRPMASSISVLILVTLSSFCHARPHAHGVLEHKRYVVHLTKVSYANTKAASGSEIPSSEFGNILPSLTH